MILLPKQSSSITITPHAATFVEAENPVAAKNASVNAKISNQQGQRPKGIQMRVLMLKWLRHEPEPLLSD